MSLLWMDGFDSYGGNSAYMLNGLWGEVGFGLSAANPRTGGYALRLPNNANTAPVARRVFGGDKTTVGVGFGMFMATLPSVSNMLQPIQWRDAANAIQCYLQVTTTGDLAVVRGATVLALTSTAVLTANAYNHLEAKATIDDAAGAVEVRVNEVTVINLTGADTKNTAVAGTSQVGIGQPSIFYAPNTDFDDIFAWDDQTGVDPVGGDVVDFVGDKKVIEDVPDEDGSEQDWARSAGSTSYSLLDDIPPNDDTDYVTAANAADQVALRFPNLPATTISVVALEFDDRSKKTDAGTATRKLTARSGVDTADGPDVPVTTAYTYRASVFQADPATGMPFTPSAAEAVEAILERTA